MYKMCKGTWEPRDFSQNLTGCFYNFMFTESGGLSFNFISKI